MRVAVIGSRTLTVHNLADYLPKDTTELISGGVGVLLYLHVVKQWRTA